jgi:hypothetical protein
MLNPPIVPAVATIPPFLFNRRLLSALVILLSLILKPPIVPAVAVSLPVLVILNGAISGSVPPK